MASGPVVFIPPNGANIVTGGQAIPGTTTQPPETVQFVQYVAQPVGNPINQPQQNAPGTGLQKLLKAEPTALGVVQIMIGLIHVGFGAIPFLFVRCYVSFATFGAYPFWGGLFFIASGSLSLLVAKRQTSSLVRCSTGLNITSAVMAVVGSILYCLTFFNKPNAAYDNLCFTIWTVATGISIILFLFTLLEFSIAVSTAHFGCKATCCSNEPETIVVAYATMTPSQTIVSAPPSYNHAASLLKTE